MSEKPTARQKPLRWRQQKRERWSRLRGYELWRGDERLVVASENGNGGWYWYGYNTNTAHRPVPTFDDVKKQVSEFLTSNEAKP